MSYTLEIQTKARELLTSRQVECVIGYEVGPRGRTRPAFVYDVQDVERLVWNQACTHNLTTYLNDKLNKQEPVKNKTRGHAPGRVAVVVKPCDSRAINVLLAENHVLRELVHVIGVVCGGILEKTGQTGNLRSVQPLPISDLSQVQSRCQRCEDHMPVIYDTLIGECPTHQEPSLGHANQTDLIHLQAMTPAERAEYWLDQFDRCIRCYACRQVCPMCNCPTCLYERDDSLWVGIRIGLNEKRTFHLGRAFHLAGRCIGCDECERVCPMNIPISLLNRMLAQEVDALFGHRAGLAPIPPPFVTVLSSS